MGRKFQKTVMGYSTVRRAVKARDGNGRLQGLSPMGITGLDACSVCGRA